MRIETITRKLYPFDELSEDAKDKAIESLYDTNVHFDWWDDTYEDAAQIGLKITEFDIDRGSYVKGDWTEDADNVARLIIENHGGKCETHKDATTFLSNLAKEKKGWGEDFEVEDAYEDMCREFERAICEDYRILLQQEYEYLSSRKAIIETIEANEYEFTEDGKLA